MGIYSNPKIENPSNDHATDVINWFKEHGELKNLFKYTEAYLEYKDALRDSKHLVCVYRGGLWVGAAVIIYKENLIEWLDDPRVLYWFVVEDQVLAPTVDESYRGLFRNKERDSDIR